MILFSKTDLPLTLLGAAAVLGGCVGAAPLEGDDEQETQAEVAEAADLESAGSIDPDAEEAVGTARQALETTWTCWYRLSNGISMSIRTVTIWWGHTRADAEWACNNWSATCRDTGNCWSSQVR
ncbi:hypothetical protein BE08_37415 [Sorangium cellulosum]|uniref:Uncharacterized protein n=1 Tax=Sorangium cellulosum TaxID=56 RepID=A0A150PBP8_SORCE|nr:hypothetical protein BE08_37415 [Sorangium cellulosum]